MITGAARLDGAILVVAATDGPMPPAVARAAGSPGPVCPTFSGRPEQGRRGVDERELLELVELEVAKLLAAQEFDEDAPVIKVSALKALEGDEKWVASIVELMGCGRRVDPGPGSRDRQAVPDARRGRLHDHQAAAPWSPVVWSAAWSTSRGSRDRRHPSGHHQTTVTGVETVPQAARPGSGRRTTSGLLLRGIKRRGRRARSGRREARHHTRRTPTSRAASTSVQGPRAVGTRRSSNNYVRSSTSGPPT